jgi:tRNA threonylcarbamoyladenosine biosynthesis protein TsaE
LNAQATLTYQSESDQETILLGKLLGSLLSEGDVLALVGELGCGKTWFTKGVALGLKVSPDTVVTSPTFALMNDYQGRVALFHIDVYRLENLADFLSAGLEEYLNGEGVVAMEWADRWPEILPESRLKVEFTITGPSSRRIVLSGDHPRALEILEAMREGLREK